MLFLISFFIVTLQAYIIYDGNQLVDSWALLNTAGTFVFISFSSFFLNETFSKTKTEQKN